LLALLTATTSRRAASTSASSNAIDAVPSGLVATTVAVFADGLTLIRPRDRIDLVATRTDTMLDGATDPSASTVATAVLVLAVLPPDAAAQPRVARVIVAAQRAVAVRIAAYQGSQTLAVVTEAP
jgi:hypothetical protein